MGKVRTVLSCRDCGQQLAQWAGRCPGCGAWGTIEEGWRSRPPRATPLETLAHEDADERRVSTGLPGHRSRSRRRAGALHRGPARRGARHRQVDPSPPDGGQLVGRRAPLPVRVRRGVAPAGLGPGAPARDRRLEPVVRVGPRAPGRGGGRSFRTALPAGGRFDPGAPRSRGGPGAGRTVAGPGVRGRAGGVRQGRGDLGPGDRARHQGRRPRRPPSARARRGRGPGVRRRSAFGAADALGRQEPVRGRGRGGLVRDDRVGPARDRPRRPPATRRGRARRGHGAAARGSPRARGRGSGARLPGRGHGPAAGERSRSPEVPAGRGGARQRRPGPRALGRVRGRRREVPGSTTRPATSRWPPRSPRRPPACLRRPRRRSWARSG